MAIYHFNLHIAQEKPDTEGHDFVSFEAAKRAGVELLSEVLRRYAGQIADGEDCKIDITDNSGLILFTIIALSIEAPAALKKSEF